MKIWLLSCSIGTFIGVLVWMLYRVFSVVPKQDRAYMDRPPAGFRLVWPLIQALVHYGGHWLPVNYSNQIELRLKQAGVEYTLSAAQFFYAKVICAMSSTLVLLLFLPLQNRAMLFLLFLVAVAGFLFPELLLRETTTRRTNALVRGLPFYLDVITLAVEAGSNLTGGITQAVQKSADGPLRSEFNRVLRDIRAGKSRADALRALTERSDSRVVGTVVGSMIQAERAGSSLGPVLRAQTEQLRSQRFQQAEKLAMEAPIKLLAPLVLCIFPTTFLVIGFVIIGKAIQAGIFSWPLLLWAYGWPD